MHEQERQIAVVALNVPIDRTFDYLVPPELAGSVVVGGRVRVPFGNRPVMPGYCVELRVHSDCEARQLKQVLSSLDNDPIFAPAMLELARWMARYYACSFGEALHAAVPAAVRARRARRKVWVASLAQDTAASEAAADEIFSRSSAQSRILRALVASDGEAPVAVIKRATRTSMPSFKVLARNELITLEKRSIQPDDPLLPTRSELVAPPELTPQQRAAFDAITTRTRSGRFDVVLLHGVTSSGKTEVYLQSIADVVQRGGQAIVLVPEISLTPQTVRHFSGRFHRLAVLHSRLTDTERSAQWDMIRRGDADVVVGARSAIFAPLQRLALLVVDEEHEGSYKQDRAPRYHARDVGIMRARADNAVVVLGSATPCLESYHNAQTHKYAYARLDERIGGHPLPPVTLVDMREQWAGRAKLRVISRQLEADMRRSLKGGHQVLLFINRRGYSPYIHCPRCNYVHKCPQCDITMNFRRRVNVVTCHYCAREERPPTACPECGLPEIKFSGTGTERVEESAQQLFPEFKTLRMDSDTTVARQAHAEHLEMFRKGEADILIGTQMIAKGLDFPNVTTVGVINADVSLHLPDFRSRERTFQLLAQVAGRTGRGPAGGRVFVQTFMPDDPSIRAAVGHDYARFAAQELPHRRELRYPPYGRMVRIVCRGRDNARVERFAAELGAALRRICAELADGSHVLGPAPAPVAKRRGQHRHHILIKCPGASAVRALLAEVSPLLKAPSGVMTLIDVDPMAML